MRIIFGSGTLKGIVYNARADRLNMWKAIAFCAGLLILPSTSQAQSANTILPGSANQHSPSVAINPKNPQNVVVATAGGHLYRTADGGTNWVEGNLDASVPNSGTNVLVAERKGGLYNFHLSGGDSVDTTDRIVCQLSKDNGVTWTVVGGITAAGADIRRPGIGMNTKSGEFLLLWTQYDRYGSQEPAHKSRIMLAQSKDGKKWSDPVRVSQEGDCLDDDRTPQGGKAVVSTDGYMVSTWAYDQRIYLDRSFDKGRTWLSNDIDVVAQPGGWALDIPGLASGNGLPTLLIDKSPGRFGGSLYLIWADEKEGNTDVWFSRSLNYGDNWTPPVRVNDDEKGSHQFTPAAAIDQSTGKIYVVYYDRRAGEENDTEVYLAYSADQGATFKNTRLSETAFQTDVALSIGDRIGIDAAGGVIVSAWTRVDNGVSSVAVAVIRDGDLETKAPTK